MIRISLIILLLTGCESIQKKYDSDMEMIKWIRLTDKELLEQCGAYKNECTIKRYDDGFCYVYTRIPKFVDDNVSCMLGHGAEHCFFGPFHGEL